MPPPKPEQKYSYADFLTWDESERWEIIDGVPYMQATPSRAHQEILGELLRQFANFLKDKPCKVYPAPFCVRLDTQKNNEDVKKVVEPDITIVCNNSKLDKAGCKGAPDMVIEILSPSTRRHDKIRKFNLYEKSGVKEYWLVDPDEKIVTVFTLQDDGRYGRPEMYTEEDKIKVSIFTELEINLDLVFN